MAERSRPIDDERNALVLKELEHIHATIARLEGAMGILSTNLDAVRTAELKSIRESLTDSTARITAEQARQESDLKLLRYQMGRSNAMWGLIITPVTAAVVAGAMALLMRH